MRKRSRLTNFRQSIAKDFTHHKYLYLMAIPVVVYYILFHYQPMYGAIIAFKDGMVQCRSCFPDSL